MKYLCAIDVNGLSYRVFVCSPDAECLEGNEGIADYTAGVIWLRDTNPSRLRDTLVHEILHACMDASGVSHLLDSLISKRTKTTVREAEELIVRALTPCLITALRSANLLGNMPK